MCAEKCLYCAVSNVYMCVCVYVCMCVRVYRVIEIVWVRPQHKFSCCSFKKEQPKTKSNPRITNCRDFETRIAIGGWCGHVGASPCVQHYKTKSPPPLGKETISPLPKVLCRKFCSKKKNLKNLQKKIEKNKAESQNQRSFFDCSSRFYYADSHSLLNSSALLHVCAFFSYAIILRPLLSPDLFVFALRDPCVCWRKDSITRSCALHISVTWSVKIFSP